jgi:hypothetical protein
MGQPTSIDVTFDFRQDTPPGADPDRHSRTLRCYHRLLWSKPLPVGATFVLDDSSPKAYLYHRSPLGEFLLSSDSVREHFRSVLERQLDLSYTSALIHGDLAPYHLCYDSGVRRLVGVIDFGEAGP